MDGENFTDISIRNNKLSNSFCPEIARSTQAVSKQVSGTHCKKVKRGMSLADYFCTCLVKCKHCTRRWDGFLSSITASTSPSLVTGVSFGSRKNAGPRVTFAVSVMIRLKLLYCSVLSSSRLQGQDINLCAVKWSRLCLQCVPSCQETKTTVKSFWP